MKKSWMLFLVGTLLAAGNLAFSARAQNSVVYAVEYNQSTNRFGTINLLNGTFTQISSIGTAMINDIAYCPTNGILYGISNSLTLVTFNKINGALTTVASLSVSGIESLAFRYSDGALFGASQSALYMVNPTTGKATSVGSYGSPTNLGSTGQNIRFAQDGNLYVSNTSTNTDMYRINTTNGAATRMGQAVGFPYLMLQNASSNMYGVFINLGSGASNAVPELATFNLSSFVNGGTNANGSTHQIAVTLVGAGTNFPANFNFSGNVSQAVTNLTVPVSASGLSNQTAAAGSSVVFSTVAAGTGPYNYAWSKNGAVISGQTNSTLTLNNVTTNDAATYSVIVGGAMGTATNSATLTVNVPVTVTAVPVNQTVVAAGNATFSVTATGTSLSYQWLFNGSVIGTSSSLTLNNVTTSQAGIYTVIVNGAVGSATNSATLTVNKAIAAVTLGSLNQTYTGMAETATASTTPTGLTVALTYNGLVNAPTNTGSYTVIGTINDSNYQGGATNTLVISKATGAIALGRLSQTYDGSAKAATATTTPGGLAVSLTYNGSATAPTSAGSYTVIGTINDSNYQGGATNTLVIAQASGAITLGSLNQTYTGMAETATASTTPTGLTVALTYNGLVNAPTNTGSYTVIGTINDANYQGGATNTLVISKATGAIALGSLSQTYDGSAKAATATTTPSGLAVSLTYNGLATAPTSAGSYTVIGTINDANYQGGATNTLVIAQASGAITLGSLNQTYTGSAETATATTTPSGLAVSLTYNGSATAPTSAGSYTVIGTINDSNYLGGATNTLVIAQASGAITLGSLNQTYSGSAETATATTTPGGLAVSFTYNGSATVPTSAGSYTVIGTINDANYQGSATNTLVISQASGAITFGNLNQTYSGTAKPVTATTTPAGLTVNFTYNDSVNAPTNAGSYTVIGTINDANYLGGATNTLVISKATGAIALGSLSQTYDGSAKVATATTTPGGLAVSLTYNGSATAPTSAGSYTVIGTINDSNYQGGATNTLVIAQASGAITLGSLNQTYDGSAKAATATTIPSGLAVSLTYNGLATASASAGSYTVIGTINDANYQGGATNTLVINAGTLTYTANAASMTYGSAVPVLSGSVTGFVGTDNQGNATTGTLTFTTTVTSSSDVGGYAINGAGLTANNGNYTFVQATGNPTALTINALPVNLTGTRSYDGTTTIAAGMLSVANKVGSDNVTVVAGSGTLAGANVGSEAITSFGTLALGGTAAGNYALGGASGSVNITASALALTVTNLLAVDKVYDGTANAMLDATSAGLTGVLNGDDVTLVSRNAVAYFADKNADTNKPVTVTGLALVGAASANYTLVDPTNLTANITAAELTVSGVTATSKVYEGTTNAQLSGTATLSGVVSGDDVSLDADDASAAFASPNAGTSLLVAVSGYAITGADAGNYTLAQPSGLTADITAVTLTLAAVANTRTYDGSTSAAAMPAISGLQGSDTVTGLAETYDTPDAGTGKTLSVSAYTVNDGNNGNNYTVNTVTSIAGVVDKASSLILLGNLSQIYSGMPETAAATTTPSGLAVSLTYNGSATVPTSAGSYMVIGTINDANYQGSATNTLVISQASGTVALGSLNQTYDGSAKAAAAITTPSGLAVSFTYNGSATVPTSAGSYTVIGTINDANYQGSATNTLVISQASGAITFGNLNQTYSGTAKPVTATTTPAGLTVNFTYNDSVNAPTNAGSYTVIGTINDANYQGSATNTLAIAQAQDEIVFGNLNQTYDGTAKPATANTTPNGLAMSFTYNGLVNAPTNAGSYTVIGTVNDINYQGSLTNTLIINKADLTVTADNKTKIYGMSNPPLTASYNGFVNGENASALSLPVVLSTTATNTSEAAKYPITASGAAAANYSIQYVNGTLQVFSAPQVAGACVSVNGTQQYVVSWQTITNQTYQLEYTTDLMSNWTPLGTPFAGIDGIIAVTNNIASTPQCFFRVEVLEVQ